MLMRLILNEDTSSQIQIARCFRTMVPNVAVAASLCRGAFPSSTAAQRRGYTLRQRYKCMPSLIP